MSALRTMFAAVYCTTSRYQPLRHRTGIFPVGRPARQSLVFVSGNYYSTVRDLRKSLRGIDCWLLVADSAGINVWCAAGAGDFTEHKVADAVNACALADHVDHRTLILPQLAADALRNRNRGAIKGDIKTIPDVERILKS